MMRRIIRWIGIGALLYLAGCACDHCGGGSCPGGFCRKADGAEVTVQDDLTEDAGKYIAEHSKVEEQERWNKKMVSRFKGMISENEAISDPNAAADIVFFDYLADHHKHFDDGKLDDSEKLELCRFYALYKVNEWKVPSKIAPYLTRASYRKFILDDNIDWKEPEQKEIIIKHETIPADIDTEETSHPRLIETRHYKVVRH